MSERTVCIVDDDPDIREAMRFALELDGTSSFLTGTDGARLELEYVGSGFVAGERGLVITNRHVLQPWWNNAAIQTVVGLGYEPRFLLLEPAQLAEHVAQLADSLHDVARSGLALRPHHPGVFVVPAHALAEVEKRAPQLPTDAVLLVNLSGRGDKDLGIIEEARSE